MDSESMATLRKEKTRSNMLYLELVGGLILKPNKLHKTAKKGKKQQKNIQTIVLWEYIHACAYIIHTYIIYNHQIAKKG